MNTISDLLSELKQGVCIVTYKKIDTGRTRKMHCTLNPSKIPKHVEINQQSNSDTIVVWCTDKKAWRSFIVSTMIEWRVK